MTFKSLTLVTASLALLGACNAEKGGNAATTTSPLSAMLPFVKASGSTVSGASGVMLVAPKRKAGPGSTVTTICDMARGAPKAGIFAASRPSIWMVMTPE